MDDVKEIGIKRIEPEECPINKFNCVDCKYYTCLGYREHIGCYYLDAIKDLKDKVN
jgi:hypothetical protein